MVRSTSTVSVQSPTQTVSKIPSHAPTSRRRRTTQQIHHVSLPTSPNDQDIAIVSVQSSTSSFPGYRRGNLISVEMWNFLTFSHTLIRPGPRMNLVIGPNGTGKSTIVNAVCIAFGGSPRLLGRNPDLGAFVKHGTSEARVEVQIYDPNVEGGVVVVKRVFDCDGRGYFTLDGKKIGIKEFQAKVNRSYDIQLDNLSQFMPQEKIAEFVNIKPDELLTITVRSLGGAEKEELLQELVKIDETFSNENNSLQQRENQLKELQERQSQDAEEVEAYRQQQQVRKKLELYKRFQPYLEEAELKDAYITLLQQRKNIEEDLAKLEGDLRSVSTGPINQCKQAVEAASEACRAAKHSSSVHDETTNDFLTKAEDLGIRLTAKLKELAEVEEKANQLKQRIEQQQTNLVNAEAELREDEQVDGRVLDEQQKNVERDRNNLRRQIMMAEDQRSPLERQRQEAHRAIRFHNQKLSKVGDVRQRRLEALSQRPGGRYLRELDHLVRELKNDNRFRGNVYGPAAAEIEVRDTYHARIMEACVTGFLTTAFVTENAHDSKCLIVEAKKRFQGWAPDVITAPTTSNDEPDWEAIRAQVPPRPLDDRLRSLGLVCSVSEIYNAPAAVRAALNAQASLHNIFVGNDKSDQCKDDLRNEKDVYAWFTPTARCQVIPSRYDRSVRTLKVETQFANARGHLYSGSVEEAEKEKERLKGMIRQEEQNLENTNKKLDSLDKDVAQLREDVRSREREIQEINLRRNQRRKLQEMVATQRRNVAHSKKIAQDRDPARAKEVLVGEIRKCELEALKISPKLSKSVVELKDSLVRLDDLSVKKVDAERKLAVEESKHTTMKSAIEEKVAERQNIRQQAREAKQIWKAKQHQARQSLSEDELRRHEAEWNEVQRHDVNWLTERISSLAGQIQGLHTGGQSMLDAFEHRAKKIAMLEQDISQLRNEQATQMRDLQTRKQEFLTWLDTGVNKMRIKFASLYRRLGCSGDLQLVGTQCERLSELALQILVSYRDGVDLRPISATSNSGGEKMCCTMLFCFSLLQEEERMPPFVMVDELNQGLDPVNEMKIMTMMFEDAEKESAPQSFVITPKLLLNLPFHSRTKTHIIFNGNVTGKLDVVAPQQ